MSTYSQLIHSFTTFLTVCIHQLLYERNLYPLEAFLLTRAYNYPVRQCRHPRVCLWITDAISAISTELSKCSVARIAVVIYDSQERILERVIFDVENWPLVPLSEQNTLLSKDGVNGGEILPKGDLEEQYRATLSRFTGCGQKLGELPDGCTFTLAVELKDDQGEPPIGHPQTWIPVEPEGQKTVEKDGGRIVGVKRGAETGGIKTIPIRRVGAGEMIFEVWIEEGSAKETHNKTDGDDYSMDEFTNFYDE